VREDGYYRGDALAGYDQVVCVADPTN
jgi:hypothetical protein